MTLQGNDPPAAKPKRQKPKSRPKRWAEAAAEALSALDAITEKVDAFDAAISDLRSIQEEYEEWRDNLLENLRTSPVGEKLEVVCDLEIENLAEELTSAIDEIRGKVEEAEGTDLPQGFGRD